MTNQDARLSLFLLGGGQDCQDDEKASNDAPDVYAKFIETQTLAAAMGRRGDVDAFAEETQGIDARASRIYATIAKAAEAKTLAKSAAASGWDEPLTGAPGARVARIEKTVIGSTTVCAEIDSNNHVLKTYIEGKN